MRIERGAEPAQARTHAGEQLRTGDRHERLEGLGRTGTAIEIHERGRVRGGLLTFARGRRERGHRAVVVEREHFGSALDRGW